MKLIPIQRPHCDICHNIFSPQSLLDVLIQLRLSYYPWVHIIHLIFTRERGRMINNTSNTHAKFSYAYTHTHLISSMIGLKRDVFITNSSSQPNLDNPYENTPAFDIYSARQRCLGLSAHYVKMFNARDRPISQQRAGI